MELILTGISVHLFLILIFALIYWIFGNQFTKDITGKRLIPGEFIDYLYISLTVQASIGYQGITPFTNIGKFILIIQQFTVIMTNILVFYLVHLHVLGTYGKKTVDKLDNNDTNNNDNNSNNKSNNDIINTVM